MKRFYNSKETNVRLNNYTAHYAKYSSYYEINFCFTKISNCIEKRQRRIAKFENQKFANKKQEQQDTTSKEDHHLELSSQSLVRSRNLEIKNFKQKYQKVRSNF